MEVIEVACAVIEKDGEILIAQRKFDDSYGGHWEFPGGTRHADEKMEDCVVRELREEMGIVICPRRFLFRFDHLYPSRKVELYFYFCDWVGGTPRRIECQDYRWVKPEELREYLFLPGDEAMLTELVSRKDYYLNRSDLPQ
jgi:mutator protein MutT